MTVTDDEIADAMIIYGGSFVSALGGAFRRADATNRERIKVAFADYWERYRELVSFRQDQKGIRP